MDSPLRAFTAALLLSFKTAGCFCSWCTGIQPFKMAPAPLSGFHSIHSSTIWQPQSIYITTERDPLIVTAPPLSPQMCLLWTREWVGEHQLTGFFSWSIIPSEWQSSLFFMAEFYSVAQTKCLTILFSSSRDGQWDASCLLVWIC